MASQTSWKVSIPSYQIRLDSMGKEFASYKIVLEDMSCEHTTTTYRRFSELLSLHKWVKVLFKEDSKHLEFPRKGIARFQVAGPLLASARRPLLEAYLYELFQITVVLANDEFRARIGITHNTIVYKTLSVCPVCAMLNKSIKWVSAAVVERHSKVFLQADCPEHNLHTTEVCSNADWFRELLNHAGSRGVVAPGRFGNDIAAARLAAQPNFESETAFPAMYELSLFENGELIPQEELSKQLIQLTSSFPPSRQFMLKLLGKLARDVHALNESVLFVESRASTHPAPIIVEISFDRLILLSRLENSALLRPRIFPCVKYYLQSGQEAQCISELKSALDEVSMISGVQVMISLCVERPFADLRGVIELLRARCSTVRFIMLSLERPPQELIASINLHKISQIEGSIDNAEGMTSSTSQKAETIRIGTVDIHELLTSISKDTDNCISPKDFSPITTATLFEPFASFLGFGHYMLRASPVCGVATCLLQGDDDMTATIPLSRLIDIGRLTNELTPLISKLNETPGYISWSMAAKIRKIFKGAALSHNYGKSAPDVSAILTGSRDDGDASVALRHFQFVIVNAHMDMAAVDAEHVVNPGIFTSFIDQMRTSLKNQ